MSDTWNFDLNQVEMVGSTEWRVVPYVRYWETESDWDGDWEGEETFSTERQARAFIKKVLMKPGDQVFAYQLGVVNEGTEEDGEKLYESYEPMEFYNQRED